MMLGSRGGCVQVRGPGGSWVGHRDGLCMRPGRAWRHGCDGCGLPDSLARPPAEEEPAVPQDRLSIGVDRPAVPQVADHVPVQGPNSLVLPVSGKPAPTARWNVPPIFSSKSVFFVNSLSW